MPSRRTVIKSLAAAAMPMLAGCALPSAGKRANYTLSGTALRRVNVSEERIIRTVAGLRPFRRNGFNVSAERRNDKVLVHNYGHGGGGITLSWGSSHLAMELALATPHKQAAVLGCGALGLTAARLMQDRDWDVTIFARDLPPHTTSNIAGGQWSATSVYERTSVNPRFMGQFEQAQAHSYRYFQNLVGSKYGVRWITNYSILGDEAPDAQPSLPERYPQFYPQRAILGAGEHPFPVERVHHYDTMLVEPAVFLPALMQDFFNAGGKMEVREFHSADELMTMNEPVIINCTGLGAKALFDDDNMMPIKGRLSFLLPQSEVNYIIVGNGGLYMFPRSDGVLLGGTYERDVYDATPDLSKVPDIVAGHRRFFNAMDDPWS